MIRLIGLVFAALNVMSRAASRAQGGRRRRRGCPPLREAQRLKNGGKMGLHSSSLVSPNL